jgi:cysteine desulfuration protein SufE
VLPERLDDLIAELRDADRQERIELLIDLAKSLKPLPPRLEALKDATHRVEECQSPVYLFVELDGDHVQLFADAPIEAPTVRGFVSLLIEGLDGGTVADFQNLPLDLVQRCGMLEILGMQRISGLSAMVRRLKAMVNRAAAAQASSNP